MRSKGTLRELYPEISSAYEANFGPKSAIPPDVFLFFHELHLLQTARSEEEIQDAIWALSVLNSLSHSRKSEARRGTELAKALIVSLPRKEHEEWYSICKRGEDLPIILAQHPSGSNTARQDPQSAAKTALAVGVILQDFRGRWASLLGWQRDFLCKEVRSRCGEIFQKAQQVTDTLDRTCFSFMCARQLIRARNCTLALRLLQATPSEQLAATLECEQPPRKHSYFELYPQLLKHGDGAGALSFLNQLVQAGAYSDASLAVFLSNEDLKEVLPCMLHFVSCVREQQQDQGHRRGSGYCGFFAGRRKEKALAPMLMKISNIPHVLLNELLERYEGRDSIGKDQLMRDRAFQQGIEVVLLLDDPQIIVRAVDRLTSLKQELLRLVLRDFGRLYFLRILEFNRPPSFDADALAVERLVSGRELWTWTSSQGRSHYFASDQRASEDLAMVLCTFLALSVFLDPSIIRHFLADAHHKGLELMDTFVPENSSLERAIAAEVMRHTSGLALDETKLLMRSSGFYEAGVQGYLKEAPTDDLRTVFRDEDGFARLILVVARLSGFRNGKMDRHTLESCLGQICTACQGSPTCQELMVKLFEATLQKPDEEFLAIGSEESDPSAFTVASVAGCSRRLREACDLVRNQSVNMTLGRVVNAFLDTPPRGWVPLFNSLETVLFFLRFMERENLPLAYEKFESENASIFAADSNLRRLLSRTKKFYSKPLVDFSGDVANLCNMDLERTLSKRLLPERRRDSERKEQFDNAEWNSVVEIALRAAESMQEKFNVPMLPHHTQMITLLMFAVQVCQGTATATNRTILAKVGTGEGKSWIIAMLAAFVAMRGMFVHVIIDNDTLLERDFSTMAALFEKLHLSAGKRNFREGHQIVYCSGMDVEVQAMKDMQECRRASTNRTVMIVDEVDSLIVDDKVYNCYVDDYDEGSEVCEWWWDDGRNDSPFDHPPWKRKIMESCAKAERELRGKKEGKHYVTDYDLITFWALDERTSHVLRAEWFLWLELLRKQRLTNYNISYSTRQSVISKMSCFESYSFIFGLTGSLGTEAEKAYTRKHFKASHFMVPNFLDTCQGQTRPVPRCILTEMTDDAPQQLDLTVNTAKAHCSNVPILVVVRDQDRVQKVAEALRFSLPEHAASDRLGPAVVELLDKPGQEGEFQQNVEIATQPLEATSSGTRYWRVTVTTAVGARGQDYHISDEAVDENGGFLLIVEYVPDSEREWVQFLGRTARHDHPGQYAVILNKRDYAHIFAAGGAPMTGPVVKTILEYNNTAMEKKLMDTEKQIDRGRVMHTCTSKWWRWSKKHEQNKEEWQERFSQWVELCEKFEVQKPEEILNNFATLDLEVSPDNSDAEAPQENNSIENGANDPDKGLIERKGSLTGKPGRTSLRRFEGRRIQNGEGRRKFEDGRVYEGQWAKGRMNGNGKLVWPSGQEYTGQFKDGEIAGTGMLQWPDGRKYDGEWARGKPHGRGSYTDARGHSWKGIWTEGRKTSGEEEGEGKAWL
mmetsp:Transcript_23597/g.52290  ORF Transcript_23597/g.52290 Transcript_23597/m.52290 type:complete len:1502 (+) Transcript_23597:28-4533(+)